MLKLTEIIIDLTLDNGWKAVEVVENNKHLGMIISGSQQIEKNVENPESQFFPY